MRPKAPMPAMKQARSMRLSSMSGDVSQRDSPKSREQPVSYTHLDIVVTAGMSATSSYFGAAFEQANGAQAWWVKAELPDMCIRDRARMAPSRMRAWHPEAWNKSLWNWAAAFLPGAWPVSYTHLHWPARTQSQHSWTWQTSRPSRQCP